MLTIAVALIAWVSGPSGAAGRLRSGTTKVIGSVREGGSGSGSTPDGSGSSCTNKAVIRGAVLGLALLAYVMADHPTGAFTFTVLVIAVVILLVVELLSRPPAPGRCPRSRSQLARTAASDDLTMCPTVGSSDTTRPTGALPTRIAPKPIIHVEMAR